MTFKTLDDMIAMSKQDLMCISTNERLAALTDAIDRLKEIPGYRPLQARPNDNSELIAVFPLPVAWHQISRMIAAIYDSDENYYGMESVSGELVLEDDPVHPGRNLRLMWRPANTSTPETRP